MERKDFRIEICANSVASCIAALEGGADRVELCAGIPEGGTTPSAGMIRCAREAVDIGLNVIIRPRGGDFLYSPGEIKEMLYDIGTAKEYGADGLVFGCLTPEGDVDMRSMSLLMEAAGDIPVTFHRAFDHCRNPHEAMETLIKFGCRRILTSGCSPSAETGASTIAELVALAGDRICIMPGCGINSGNIAQIAALTGAREFHMSARRPVESRMNFRRPDVLMGSEKDGYSIMETDRHEVAAAIEGLLDA